MRELAAMPHLVLVCGRYEGIDERVVELAIDEELSIGDYVLSGGELGALVIIDAVARFVPGVLGEATSTDEESHTAGLLEYPQYTRPPVVGGLAVPSVLSSGNHAAIARWRRGQSLERTAKRRPDLWARFMPAASDRDLLPASLASRTHVALVHHPVVDRTGKVVTTSLTNFDIHDLARSTRTYGLAAYHIVTPVTSQREKAEHIARLWLEDPDHAPVAPSEAASDAPPDDAAPSDTPRSGATNDASDAPQSSAPSDAARGEAAEAAPSDVTPAAARLRRDRRKAARRPPATGSRAGALALVRTADSIETVIAALTAEHGEAPIVVATSAREESFPAALRRTPDELVGEASALSAPVLLLLGTGWGLADTLIPSVSRVLAPIEGHSDWNHLSVRSAGAVMMDRLFGRRPRRAT